MAARRDAEKAAQRELRRLDLWGARREISPVEALGEELERTAGRVIAIEQRLSGLDDDQLDSARGRGLAAELSHERGQLQRVAEAAARAGVPERATAVTQEQGLQIATALRGLLRDLELSPRQDAAAPALLRWHLSAFSGAGEGVRPPRPSELTDGTFFDLDGATRLFESSQSGSAGPPPRHQAAGHPTPSAALPPAPDEAQLIELRATVARRRNGGRS